MMLGARLQLFERVQWGLVALTVVLGLGVWAVDNFPLDNLGLYDVFPLLGLLAFGVMWTHFIGGALRRWLGVETRHEKSMYMTISMGVVLGLIVFHPVLLWIGLWLDGLGLPPMSYVTAYKSQLLAVLLGTVGLCIFLAFELKRWFEKARWWRAVEYLQVAGMVAIFFHALTLGGELRHPWYEVVWWLYGVTLVAATVYTEVYDKQRRRVGEHGTKT